MFLSSFLFHQFIGSIFPGSCSGSPPPPLLIVRWRFLGRTGPRRVTQSHAQARFHRVSLTGTFVWVPSEIHSPWLVKTLKQAKPIKGI